MINTKFVKVYASRQTMKGAAAVEPVLLANRIFK
jgi:hypothetical protein